MILDTDNLAGPMIHQAAFTLSSKSLNRLMIAAVAISYYGNTARTLDAAIMIYDSRLKNFKGVVLLLILDQIHVYLEIIEA